MALCPGTVNAQSGTHDNPVSQNKASALEEQNFAAVSVRPSSSKELGYRLRTSAGRLTIVGITAKELVEYAYDLKPFQVRGGPGWTSDDKFDVTAVVDESIAALDSKEDDYRKETDRIRLMTQHMLSTRFGLVAHKETAIGVVYELSVAKPMTATNHPGLRLYVAGAPLQASGASSPGSYNATMTNVPISTLALRIEDYLKSPVIDKTNLSGMFDISMSWFDPLSDDRSASGPTLEESLGTQLDLKVIRRKGAIENLVIDKLDTPSAN
jgi:uncharacterized protein (TIGR03435 family)